MGDQHGQDVSFIPLDGYEIQTVAAVCGRDAASTVVTERPAQLTAGGMVLPVRYTGRAAPFSST